MAAPAVVVKIVLALRDKNVRKIAGAIIIAPIALIATLVYFVTALFSGTFSLVYDSESVAESYKEILGSIDDTFAGLRMDISSEAMESIEEFMPGFTLIVSKARLEEKIMAKDFVAYDISTFPEFDEHISSISESIKYTYSLLRGDEGDKEIMAQLGGVEFRVLDFYNDGEFNADEPDYRKFSGGNKITISKIAFERMSKNKFIKYNTTYKGKKAISHQLTHEGKTIEFLLTGDSEVDAVKLLAMFQLKNSMTMTDALNSGQYTGFDNDLALLHEELTANPTKLFKMILNTNSGKNTSPAFDFLSDNTLQKTIERSIDNGFFQTEIIRDSSKLTIISEMPSSEDWLKIFQIPENKLGYADSYELSLRLALADAEIDNTIIQVPVSITPFRYFDGIVQLPAGLHGVSTNFGQDLPGHGDIYEEHLFSELKEAALSFSSSANTPITFCVPENDEIVKDIIVTVNAATLPYYSNIMFQYIIDTELFLKRYMFPLSDITGSSRDSFYLSYSCFDTIGDIRGGSLFENYHIGDEIFLGYGHGGHVTVRAYSEKEFNPLLLYHFENAEISGMKPYVSTLNQFGLIWPLQTQYRLLTTHFGFDPWRNDRHDGIDVGDTGIGGTPIFAVKAGTVVRATNDGDWHGGYGNYVLIDHGGGLSTLYAHAITGSVRAVEGQMVKQGDIIALVGDTGWATGDHLHFEVKLDGALVNPMNYYR